MVVEDVPARAQMLADLGRSEEAEPLLALTGQPEVAQGTLGSVQRLVDVLRKVPAPADSEFAEVTRDLGDLLDAHALASPGRG